MVGKKYSEGKDYKVIACVLANFFNDEQSRFMKYMARECEKANCKVVFFSTTTDFFFNDFWHFVMLLLVCYTLSPKINVTSNSPVTWNSKKEEDS